MRYFNNNDISTRLHHIKRSHVPVGSFERSQGLSIKKVSKAFFILFLPFLLILGGYYVYEQAVISPYFQISKLEIKGTHTLKSEQVKQLLKPALGYNIFQVNFNLVTDNLTSNPWIETVKISRKLPDRLLIEIKERAPFAKIKTSSEDFFLIDKNAFVIKKIENKEYQMLPAILINTNTDYHIGEVLEIKELWDGLDFIKKINDFRKPGYLNFTTIMVEAGSRFTLKTPFSNVRLSKNGLIENLEKLKIASRIIEKEDLKVKMIDLTFRDQVVLKLL